MQQIPQFIRIPQDGDTYLWSGVCGTCSKAVTPYRLSAEQR